jgi:hypothetical protein
MAEEPELFPEVEQKKTELESPPEPKEEPEAKEELKPEPEPVHIPVVQGYPLPDDEEELAVMESLNHLNLITENEVVDEEEEFFEWSLQTTIQELFTAFPEFGKGKKALKIMGDELIFIFCS